MIFDKNIAKEVALLLLDAKAIKLQPNNPFTWASGWKSPIYCDNRVTLSFPSARKTIAKSFAALARKHYPEANLIAGVATGAIAHGILVAEELQLPFAYVRAAAKEHGLGNQIEGFYEAGQKAVVVEDLISTGKSSLQVVDVLRQNNIEVIGMVSIFQYGFETAATAFKQAGVPCQSLTSYPVLVEMAIQKGLIPASQQSILIDWSTDPANWKGV
jgi:orotate phosphoribosyltransferase